MRLTRHAQKRCQQRGLRECDIKLIYEFGRKEYARQGAVKYCLDRKLVRKLRESLNKEEIRIRRLRQSLIRLEKGAIAVAGEDGEEVMTVYKRDV